MKAVKTISKALTALITMTALASFAWAGTWNTELHITNKTGQSIGIKNIKIRVKKGFKWKSWKTLQSSTTSLANNKEHTKKKSFGANYKYQFTADLKCKDGKWKSYRSNRVQDTSDFDANMFYKVTLNKDGSCNVKKTHDG